MDPTSLRSWLESVQNQIRAFDTKAQICMGIDGVLAGIFLDQGFKFSQHRSHSMLATFFDCALVAGLSAATLSWSFAVLVIIPRLSHAGGKSKIYFGDLAPQYEADPAEFRKKVLSLTDHEYMENLVDQIGVNSLICAKKSRWSTLAIQLGAATFVFFVASSLSFSLLLGF